MECYVDHNTYDIGKETIDVSQFQIKINKLGSVLLGLSPCCVLKENIFRYLIIINVA